MTPDAPRLVLFDLDGCLVDSEPLSLQALVAEIRAAGFDGLDFEDMRDRFLGVTLADIVAHVESELGHAVPEGFGDRFHERLYALYAERLERIDAMVAVAERLAAEGVAIAIASGGSAGRIRHTLDLTRLREPFGDRLFSGEEVGRGKPAPDLFLHAARRLDMPPGTACVVEDSPHGIEGARRAGMRAIGFTGGTHLDGIRAAQARRLLDAGAACVVEDASEVYPAIMDARLGLDAPRRVRG
ncbi:HAD family phosphatase [uncultured Jannaschia sp.]|uniref:HAD family hydrolase n=1 Tax=uncultured Jannaschia sp. TaxID=293347 RepID=UPI002601AE4D|nr:HAD family phosphatase [uncultured Jannaschia sp.]